MPVSKNVLQILLVLANFTDSNKLKFSLQCLICNKACYTKRTLRKHICLKHNLTGADAIACMGENPEPEDSINIAELLNEENMVQVDIVELENLNNEADSDEVQVKSEPISDPEEETSEFEDDEPEPESDDDKDKDFVIKSLRSNRKTALRSSPRTRNNPKLYKYDFSDDDD